MELINKQFEENTQAFHGSQKLIPKDLAWCLGYLLDFIHNHPKNIKVLTEEQKREISSIHDLSSEEAKEAFSFMVGSLLSPDLYISSQKRCELKVLGQISKSIMATISFGPKHLNFANRK
jgi:hypothetical protein